MLKLILKWNAYEDNLSFGCIRAHKLQLINHLNRHTLIHTFLSIYIFIHFSHLHLKENPEPDTTDSYLISSSSWKYLVWLRYIKIHLVWSVFRCIVHSFASNDPKSASISQVPKPHLLLSNDLRLTWVQRALISAAQVKWTKGVNTPDFE